MKHSPGTARTSRLSLLAAAALALLGTWPTIGADEPPAPPTLGQGATDRRHAPPGDPLVGANYTHLRFDDCDFSGRPLLRDYHHRGVRATARRQLATMQADGMDTLRLLIWHMDRPRRHHDWGVLDSRGGTLTTQAADNLRALLEDVRRAGYRRLTVAFGPQWANHPSHPSFDPTLYEQNWQFIRQVRALAVAHGPAVVRFDLLNEGAPSRTLPAERYAHTEEYLQRLWASYVSDYGTADATVSAIADDRPDGHSRLRNLVEILAADGAPAPRFLDVHVNGGPAHATVGLREARALLEDHDLDVELILGETPYDHADTAAAISEADGDVSEVVQWYSTPEDRCNVSPPYGTHAYRAALQTPASTTSAARS
ncbi:MAG: hypothetical protein KY469_19185 [Actinobacteria bacterium]|nr:hypothetical protein [Actinomycetota bacterium]